MTLLYLIHLYLPSISHLNNRNERSISNKFIMKTVGSTSFSFIHWSNMIFTLLALHHVVVNSFSWHSLTPSFTKNRLQAHIAMKPLKTMEYDISKSDTSTKIVARRKLFSEFTHATSAFVAISAVLITTSPQQISATMMDSKLEETKIFTSGQKVSKDFAIERFKLAQADMNYLLNNYDSISKDGGDAVRRYLGTVGVTSGMYGITKILKDLQDEDVVEDIVEFVESSNDLDIYLRAADTACYSANFVEFSAAKTKPEKFLKDAKVDCQNIKNSLDKIATLLGI